MVEEIKVQILSMWLAFTEAIIRFWNNRSVKVSEEVIYLRLQLEREKDNNSRLLDVIKNLATAGVTVKEENNNESTEQIHFQSNKRPWHVVQRELEQKSRQEAARLDMEARTAIEREKAKNKSVETLEEELLAGAE